MAKWIYTTVSVNRYLWFDFYMFLNDAGMSSYEVVEVSKAKEDGPDDRVVDDLICILRRHDDWTVKVPRRKYRTETISNVDRLYLGETLNKMTVDKWNQEWEILQVIHFNENGGNLWLVLLRCEPPEDTENK